MSLHNSKFYSLQKGVDDPYTIELDRAIELIHEKREKDKNKVIIGIIAKIRNCRCLTEDGAPISVIKRKIIKFPSGTDPKSLTHADCMKIIADTPAKKKKKKVIDAATWT